MSFKEFSSAHNVPAIDKHPDKSKDVPKVDQPPVKPRKASAEIAPNSKP